MGCRLRALLLLAASALLCAFQDRDIRVNSRRDGKRIVLGVSGKSGTLPAGGVLDVSCRRIFVETDLASATLRECLSESAVSAFAQVDQNGAYACEVPVWSPGFFELTVLFSKESQTVNEIRAAFDKTQTPFEMTSRVLVGTTREFMDLLAADFGLLESRIREVERAAREIDAAPASPQKDKDLRTHVASLEKIAVQMSRERGRRVLLGTASALERVISEYRTAVERPAEKGANAARKEPKYEGSQDAVPSDDSGGASSEHTSKSGKIVPVPDLKAPDAGGDREKERQPNEGGGNRKPRVDVLAKFLCRETAIIILWVTRDLVQEVARLKHVSEQEREKRRLELGTKFEPVLKFFETLRSHEEFQKWAEVEDKDGKAKLADGIAKGRECVKTAADGDLREQVLEETFRLLDRLERALTR